MNATLFTVLMTVCGTLFSITVLILSTIRFAIPMSVVYERSGKKQYDRLYDGMLFAIIFGAIALIFGVVSYTTQFLCFDCFFYSFLALQFISTVTSALIAFLPFKFKKSSNS